VAWSNITETFFYLADYGRAVLPLKQQYSYVMGISWSLAIEEQFYLVWPIALLWICKLQRPVKAVAWIVVGLWFWRALLVICFHVSWAYAYNAFDTRADALIIGCWLALAVRREDGAPRAVLWWISSKWLVLIPLVLLAAISTLDARGWIGVRNQVIEFSIDPVLTAILLLQWVYWGSTDWTLLEHPIVKFIARISYSLYLYHSLVAYLVKDPAHFVPIPHSRTVVNVALYILVASASYYGIERPFMKIRDRGKRTSVLMDDGLTGST
jgi:peptidoglycan/LPS O-acetylase OafA/YrhL